MPTISNQLNHAADSHRIPLCVDLDGTLIRTDVLVEGFLRCVKANPLLILRVFFWLLRGKAYLKEMIGRRATIEINLLPVNTGFVAWLREEQRSGRRLILCTAANHNIAEKVADHFGIFEDTICSSASHSLSGRAKAACLEAKFGEQGFDYAGNEQKDIYVWVRARNALVVAPSRGLLKRVEKLPRVERIFPSEAKSVMSLWLRELRLHQWVKNLLVFVPAFAAHRGYERRILWLSFAAFLLLGVCASATYIINDLLDLEADRIHPRKRSRPLASGDLPLVSGIVLAVILAFLAFVGAFVILGVDFLAVLLLYLLCTFWYSIELKNLAMVDVLTLGGLYTIRIVAGGIAIAIEPSFWLLLFSIFIFFSLALAKRFTELRALLMTGRTSVVGRGYSTDDLPLLLSCGTASGFVSVLVLALYAYSNAADEHYRHPEILWCVCPLILYWICRIWIKAHRGKLNDDPVVFAIKDKPSLLVGCLCLAIALLANYK